ncbi:MAG: DUF2510 domain-containing protein [Candidatus Nanopelagicales bacterium]
MDGDQQRAPGWYPDERYPEDERYWDGTAWRGTKPRGDHAVRSRSAQDAEDERSMRKTRAHGLIFMVVGLVVLFVLLALVRRG